MHRAEQEMILIAGAYTPLMRDPEEIEFIVLRTRKPGGRGER
jgi:hypothetical protein